MVDLLAVLAGIGLLEFECEYFRRVGAGGTEPSFSRLADLAFIEVALQDAEIFLNLFILMPIIYVV